MDANGIAPSCPSPDVHDDIRDPILHFLGCLECCDRDSYYHTMTQEMQMKLAKELRRISFLRNALSRDDSSRRLVDNLHGSMAAWRSSDPYHVGMMRVRAWRERHHLPSGWAPNPQVLDEAFYQVEYDPDRDTKACHIKYEKYTLRGDGRERSFSGRISCKEIPVNRILDEKEMYDHLKSSHHGTTEGWRDTNNDAINYFHLPANNMIWAERFIKRYFGEPDKGFDHGGISRVPNTTVRNHGVLQPELWDGQYRAAASPHEAHTRHLRPICKLSTYKSAESADEPSIKLVLFMPYLHWDTERQTQKLSQYIDAEIDRTREMKRKAEANERRVRRQRREGLHELPSRVYTDVTEYAGTRGAFTMAVQKWLLPTPKRPVKFRQNLHHRVIAGTRIGQVLFDAAMLYEAMAMYRDKMLIRRWLHHQPPLHPRRTLHQAYARTNTSAGSLGREQVVYRATMANDKMKHRIDSVTGRWDCHDHLEEAGLPPNDRSEFVQPYQAVKEPCAQCKRGIRKVSKLVMVDQLWLWILDDHTILTCLPQRYGEDKHSDSDVHSLIRERLGDAGIGQFKTAFDMALVILDVATEALFGGLAQDGKPEVMNIFSEAIRNVGRKYQISFESLSLWSNKVMEISNRSSTLRSTDITHLFDTSVERDMQREMKDILGEIDIMLDIIRTQERITRKFKMAWSETRFPATSANLTSATELINKVVDYERELEDLRRSAREMFDNLDYLRAMKEQQGSAAQAIVSMRQGEETVRQGRAIMSFTVITIIFLPLAFIASIFGMNNKQISGDDAPMTLQTQFKFMFPISAGIIAVSMTFAFSNFIRSLVYLVYRLLMTMFVVRSRAYEKMYIGLSSGIETLVWMVEAKAAAMKADVKKAKQRRTAQRENEKKAKVERKQVEERLTAMKADQGLRNRTGGLESSSWQEGTRSEDLDGNFEMGVIQARANE